MRAGWVVLLALLACWPARAELRARTRDLGAVSPVVDYAQWATATTMTGSTSAQVASRRANKISPLVLRGGTVTTS